MWCVKTLGRIANVPGATWMVVSQRASFELHSATGLFPSSSNPFLPGRSSGVPGIPIHQSPTSAPRASRHRSRPQSTFPAERGRARHLLEVDGFGGGPGPASRQCIQSCKYDAGPPICPMLPSWRPSHFHPHPILCFLPTPPSQLIHPIPLHPLLHPFPPYLERPSSGT